MQQLMCDLTGS